MYCDGFGEEIYSDYVLGTLATPERDEVRSHLDRECSRCRSELSLSRSVWYGVALSTPSVEPRPALRKRLMAAVQTEEMSGLRLAWWLPLASFGALAIAVVAGWQVSNLRRTPEPVVLSLPPSSVNGQALSALERENEALRGRLATLSVPRTLPPAMASRPQDTAALASELKDKAEQAARAEQELSRTQGLLAAAERSAAEANRKYEAALTQPAPVAADAQRQLAAAQLRTQQLEHDVAEYRTLLARARDRLTPVRTASLLADPNLRLVRLRSTQRGSPIEGHALLSSGSQVVFYGSQLPALPPGRAYQLWLIRGSSPAIVSAGVFQPDSAKRAVVEFGSGSLTDRVTALAVTDEPEGGSPLPTGHKLLVGS